IVTGPAQSVLKPAEVTLQFASEDGSDRTTWVRPRDGIDPGDGSETAVRDRVLRAVLAQWDFQDTAGWEPLLERTLENELLLERFPSLQSELAPVLARFARSKTCRTIAAARNCYREIEFLLNWPVETLASGGRQPPEYWTPGAD